MWVLLWVGPRELAPYAIRSEITVVHRTIGVTVALGVANAEEEINK
jgi:hypothetical protein